MKIPEKGFYYHYKHTSDSINNCAYEVVGLGHHTEMKHGEGDELLEESIFVIYRPIYKEAFVYRNGKMFDVRPLSMFLEEVTKPARPDDTDHSGGNEKTLTRFSKITDSKLISELEKIKMEMYGK